MSPELDYTQLIKRRALVGFQLSKALFCCVKKSKAGPGSGLALLHPDTYPCGVCQVKDRPSGQGETMLSNVESRPWKKLQRI